MSAFGYHINETRSVGIVNGNEEPIQGIAFGNFPSAPDAEKERLKAENEHLNYLVEMLKLENEQLQKKNEMLEHQSEVDFKFSEYLKKRLELASLESLIKTAQAEHEEVGESSCDVGNRFQQAQMEYEQSIDDKDEDEGDCVESAFAALEEATFEYGELELKFTILSNHLANLKKRHTVITADIMNVGTEDSNGNIKREVDAKVMEDLSHKITWFEMRELGFIANRKYGEKQDVEKFTKMHLRKQAKILSKQARDHENMILHG